MAVATAEGEFATPPGNGGFIAGLFAGQPVPAAAARVGAWVGAAFGPVRIGNKVVVARHAQVTDVLARDLEFRIAPVNEARIDAVNGPFVLGMDRGATLGLERRALYGALAGVDLAALHQQAVQLAEARVAAFGDGLDVVQDYARPIAAATATALFGVAGPDEQTFKDVARAVFAHVFLNIGNDPAVQARALRASARMQAWLADEIARRRQSGAFGSDMMGRLMQGGMLDDDGVRRTLGGMLVGSIDTTATAVAKIIATIGRDKGLDQRVGADADDETALAGWCRELLRLWPHNPVLLRQAAVETELAGVPIHAGDQVWLWTQAAMLDPAIFPDPGRLRPDRPAASYLHFGGGLHPCAGRAINAFQIPALVGALVRRGIASVGAVAWAGPFPDRLPVRFGR